MFARVLTFGVLTTALAVLGGCSAYLDYSYYPRPALVAIPQSLQAPATQPTTGPAPQMAPTEPVAMNVLGTVVGVRRDDPGKRLPQAVEVRLILENGAMPATFDPRQVQLTTSSLVTLDPPTAFPSDPVTLAPGQQASFLEVFALPPGFSDSTLDLSGLRLSVPITIGGRPVQAGMSFQRVVPYYLYDPYPYYPYYGPYYYARPTFYGGYYYHGYRHR